jgi:hypothetical protein
MKYHIAWAILAIITFILHMLASLYADYIFYLPEYIWFLSIAFSILAIYSGAITAARTEATKRATAIASAVIGGIVLLGLLISAVQWLFEFEEGLGSLAGLF